EDGIRDFHVTGVQTCALPISPNPGANGQGPVCNSNNNVNGLCFSTNSTANFNPCLPETACGNTTECLSNYSGVYGTYGPTATPINWSPLYGIDAAQGGWAVQIYDCIGVDVGALTNASKIGRAREGSGGRMWW